MSFFRRRSSFSLFTEEEDPQPQPPQEEEEKPEPKEDISNVQRNLSQENEFPALVKKLFNSEQFSDVKVRVGETVFNAHKVVLMTASKMFESMFTLQLKEASENEITMDESICADVKVFETFLSYVYFHEIKITNENALGLLLLAGYFQNEQLLEAVAKNLQEMITPESVGYIIAAAHGNNAKLLYNSCRNFLSFASIEVVMATEGFAAIPFNVMKDLVENGVFTGDEALYFTIVSRWIEENAANLTEHQINLLLKLVKFDTISRSMLETISSHQLVAADQEVSKLVEEAMKLDNATTKTRVVLGQHRGVPADTAKQIISIHATSKDGVYFFNIPDKAEPVPMYCNMSFEGGGWMLVRRQKPGVGWLDTKSDRLAGTVEYGKPTDERNIGPLVPESYSVKFSKIPFTEFLFMTGDGAKWLICHRDEAQKNWNGYTQCKIIKSHVSDTPYSTGWYKRVSNVEDPWISPRDHHYNNIHAGNNNDTHSMLYGSSHSLWNYWVNNRGGVNVYIR